MEEKYIIYNLLKKYEEFFDEKILLLTDNNKIDFNLNLKSFSHLLGLHYVSGKKEAAFIIANRILENRIDDSKIYNEIKTFNRSFQKTVKNRIEFIDTFLKNIEKAEFVNVIKTENNKYNSNKILIEIENNKVLELALTRTKTDEYYLETFFVRNNDNNIDYTESEKVIGIYKKDYLTKKYIPFSFDEKKQEKLDLIYNLYNEEEISYRKVLEIDLEELKEKILNKYNEKDAEKNEKWNNKNKDNDLER